MPKLVSLSSISTNKKKILLTHRIKDNSWGLIGGKIDWCETFENAAMRESMEEVSLIPTKLKYVGINNVIKSNEQHISVFYHAEEYTGTLNNNEKDKHSECKFFDIDNLPDKLFFPLEVFMPKIIKYIKAL